MRSGQTDKQSNPYIRYRNQSILMCVIILAVFFLFFRQRANETVYVLPEEDAISITSDTGEEISVSYQDIISVELLDDIEPGEVVQGTDTRRGASGIWHNDRWGDYHLFILHKAEKYIVLTLRDGVVVFNYESTAVTQDLYHAFYDLLDQKGYADQIRFSGEE